MFWSVDVELSGLGSAHNEEDDGPVFMYAWIPSEVLLVRLTLPA